MGLVKQQTTRSMTKAIQFCIHIYNWLSERECGSESSKKSHYFLHLGPFCSVIPCWDITISPESSFFSLQHLDLISPKSRVGNWESFFFFLRKRAVSLMVFTLTFFHWCKWSAVLKYSERFSHTSYQQCHNITTEATTWNRAVRPVKSDSPANDSYELVLLIYQKDTAQVRFYNKLLMWLYSFFSE